MNNLSREEPEVAMNKCRKLTGVKKEVKMSKLFNQEGKDSKLYEIAKPKENC